MKAIYVIMGNKPGYCGKERSVIVAGVETWRRETNGGVTRGEMSEVMYGLVNVPVLIRGVTCVWSVGDSR